MCKNNNPLYNRERREQARKANAKRGKTRVLPPHLQRRKTIHINVMDRDTLAILLEESHVDKEAFLANINDYDFCNGLIVQYAEKIFDIITNDTYIFEVCLDEENLKKVIKTYYV